MRVFGLIGAILISLSAYGQTSTSKLWSELKAKREMLPGLHQEFDVTQSYKTQRGTQSITHRKIVVDLSQNKWREQSIGGEGDRIRIFDGQGLFLMETDGDEYVRIKRKANDENQEPIPYGSSDLDWAKANELERRPCGFTGHDHICVIIDVPVKKWMRAGTNDQITRLSDGITRVAIDSETGMLVQCNTQEVIDSSRGGYVSTLTYSLTKMSIAAPDNAALFRLPESGVHEVKELARWDVAHIKKQLIGKQAPELGVTDMQGNLVSIAELKGKTVLLDFWTTWCPPCVADAPALDKLFTKYGGKDLMIVGISVNEERGVVEKFLKKHPHTFPVVLTSENEMPRPYQIGTFPTYIVIAPDGTLTTAVEGDQGFGDLRKFLQKAGLDTE